MNQEKINIEGEVSEVLPSTNFKVKLDNGEEILCYLAGKMRMNYIKLVEGDRVQAELSPYDLTRGRIIRRLK